jgi:hypothetical protein
MAARVERWAGYDDDEPGTFFVSVSAGGIRPGTRGWKTVIDKILKEAQAGLADVAEMASDDKATHE